MKKKIYREIARINNFFIFHFNKVNEFIKIINQKFKRISNFNKYLILLISILFFYLFYLSIPSLYDKGILQTKLNKMINEEYNINLSLSSELTYNILPKPHISIKNAKFYTNNLESPKELGQIKKIKIFISQKNFFKKDNIKVKLISINQANFSFQKKDLDYLNQYIKKKFSKKKLKIKNSNFFYIDNNDNVVSIFPIAKLNLFFDEKKLKNILISKGKFFTMPYSLNWNKNFKNNKSSTFFKIKKLSLKVKNFSELVNSDLLLKNFIFFRNMEIETDILIKKNLIEIKSVDKSKVKNNRLSYQGTIELNPFNLNTDLNIRKLDFKKSIFNNDLIRNLFEMKHLYNKNLSSKINLKIDNLIKNKLFHSSNIFINSKNGDINFNNTNFIGNTGNLNLINSNIENYKDDLIFKGNFLFNIVSKNEFYRLFQIGKKNRKDINNIYFNLEYNLTKNKFEISNLVFEPGQSKNDNELFELLNSYSNVPKNYTWIDFKIFVNKIFTNHYEG